MKNIITIASYSFLRYLKNPLSICIFILAPVIMYAYVMGSSTSSNSYVAPVIEQNADSVNNNIIIQDKNIVQKNDKLCVIYTVLFLFYFAILSAHSISSDSNNGLLKRTISASATITQTLLGKLLGNIILMYIFVVVLIGISKFIFEFSWGTNMVLTAFALFIFTIIVNNFGLIISAISKNLYLCTIIVAGINFAMSFTVFYGIYAPIKLPHAITTLQKYSLHNYMIKAIVEEGNIDCYFRQIIVLIIVAVVTGILGLIFGRRAFR